MNILVISNMYPSVADPVYGTFVKNFVEDIRRRNEGGGVDVCTIYGRRKGKLAKAAAYASYYFRLTMALASSRHDLIYVHTITFPILPIRLVSLFRRLPLVFNVHGDDVLPSNRLKKMLKRIAAPVLPKARMVVCPSEYFRGVLKAEFPALDQSKVFVSPSGGLKPQFYRPKDRISGPDEPLVLGFVSRIDRGKGWNLFVDAVAELNARGIACRGVMAGRGVQTPQLERMIADKGMSGIIDYIGPQRPEDLPELYSSFDLFVFPTCLSESLGLVGVEAMAAGTPVVASRLAGPTGYVIDGTNGFLFEPGNVDALVEAITGYARLDENGRRKMSEAARRKSLEYEAEKVGAELFEKIRSLVQAE